METSLVERLRMKGPMSFQMDWSDRAKAADEIENLYDEVDFLFHSIKSHQTEIKRLRKALDFILTDCKSDSPPNAQTLILFINQILGGE